MGGTSDLYPKLSGQLRSGVGRGHSVGMKRPVLEQLDDTKRFQLLVEAVTDYALYLLDLDGTIISWNTGASRINGYSADEVIGKNFSMFFPPEDLAAGKPARALRTAKAVGRF